MQKTLAVKVAAIAAVVLVVVVAFVARSLRKAEDKLAVGQAADASAGDARRLPKLVDLGSKTCIPCKMMEPVLEELRREYEGKLVVEFIDVMADPDRAKRYTISVIPTQIWYDASGKELTRHEGFVPKAEILAIFAENGVDLGTSTAGLPDVVREDALEEDPRPKDRICFMCEGDVDPKTKVSVRSTSGGTTTLCSPHCYFIMESCLLDKSTMGRVTVADHASGASVDFDQAVWLYGADDDGRPSIKAFAAREAADAEMRAHGGSSLTLDGLRDKEYSLRCGFCDRAMYVQDNGSKVEVVGGPKTHGCCPHCALGVAARIGKDIVVEYKDPISDDLIMVETFDGKIKSIVPPTAVAWFGQKKTPGGAFKSAGCFHQWNFANVENLKEWIDLHPKETGWMITIHQALASKMKLTPQQIQKACKIGECK